MATPLPFPVFHAIRLAGRREHQARFLHELVDLLWAGSLVTDTNEAKNKGEKTMRRR